MLDTRHLPESITRSHEPFVTETGIESKLRTRVLNSSVGNKQTDTALAGAAINPDSREACVTWDELVTHTGTEPKPPGAFTNG